MLQRAVGQARLHGGRIVVFGLAPIPRWEATGWGLPGLELAPKPVSPCGLCGEPRVQPHIVRHVLITIPTRHPTCAAREDMGGVVKVRPRWAAQAVARTLMAHVRVLTNPCRIEEASRSRNGPAMARSSPASAGPAR
jgi:hypothetical protein